MIPATILLYKLLPRAAKKLPQVVEKPPPIAVAQGSHTYPHIIRQKSLFSEFGSFIQTVQVHLNSQDILKYYKCKLCPYKTKSYFTIKCHTKRHEVTKKSKLFCCIGNNVEKYKCVECSYKTPLLINFNKHMKTAHRKTIQIKVENGTEPPLVLENFNWISLTKPYNCDYCSFETLSQLIYIRHYLNCPVYNFLKSKEPENDTEFEIEFVKKYDLELKCPKCPFVTETQSKLEEHESQVHLKTTLTRKNGFFCCEHCSYKNRSRNHFTRHVYLHMNPRGLRKIKNRKFKETSKLFKCFKCSFKTGIKKDFIKHILCKHPTGKELLWLYCTECSYRTVYLDQLNTHKQSHSYVKCSLCDYKSRLRADVNHHYNEVHVKWFTCDQDGFRTKDHNVLSEHILQKHVSQEVVTRYKCDLCTFRTFEIGELRAHVLEKHVDPQYTNWIYCEMCPAKFKKNPELKEHALANHIL